jgi:hypothetical protein
MALPRPFSQPPRTPYHRQPPLTMDRRCLRLPELRINTLSLANPTARPLDVMSEPSPPAHISNPPLLSLTSLGEPPTPAAPQTISPQRQCTPRPSPPPYDIASSPKSVGRHRLSTIGTNPVSCGLPAQEQLASGMGLAKSQPT